MRPFLADGDEGVAKPSRDLRRAELGLRARLLSEKEPPKLRWRAPTANKSAKARMFQKGACLVGALGVLGLGVVASTLLVAGLHAAPLA